MTDPKHAETELAAKTLAAELFSGSHSSAVLLSHVDIELGEYNNSDKKRLLAQLHNFATSLSECEDIQHATKQMIKSGVVGLYWCESRSEAKTILGAVYRKLAANGKPDGYNLSYLNADVGCVEVWIDR